MDYIERAKILRGLPKNSRVKYDGADILNNKKPNPDGSIPIKIAKGTIGFKIRNCRYQKKDMIAVRIAGGELWHIETDNLTCDIIEVTERLQK